MIEVHWFLFKIGFFGDAPRHAISSFKIILHPSQVSGTVIQLCLLFTAVLWGSISLCIGLEVMVEGEDFDVS